MKFTVKRNKWFRGNEGTSSSLLRKDGQRCCLGFLAQACGYQDDEVFDMSYLNELLQTDLLPQEFYRATVNSPGCSRLVHKFAAGINDNPDISDEIREKRLTELFAKYDIQVTFED